MLQRGYSSRLWIDRKRGRVTRFTCGRGRESLRRHYTFLERSKDIDDLPWPLGAREFAGCLVTTESFVPGQRLTSTQFVLPQQWPPVARALAPLYTAHTVVKKVLWQRQLDVYRNLLRYVPENSRVLFERVARELTPSLSEIEARLTWIHGDLTFRNILFDGRKVYLVDFDKSEETFAEIDVLHLWCDWHTHRFGSPSYATFLHHTAACIQDLERFNEVVALLYERMPEFSANASHQTFIARIFFVRTLAYVLKDCAERGVDATFLVAALAEDALLMTS